MKKRYLNSLIFLSLLVSLSSCEAIGSIFKAGVWSGVIIVVIIIAVIVFIVSKMSSKK